jgi:hypothetical protein
MWVGGNGHSPTTLRAGKSPGADSAGGWAGPRAGMENLAPTSILSPALPALSDHAMRTNLTVTA